MISLNIKVDNNGMSYLINYLRAYGKVDDSKLITALVNRGVELLKDEASKANFKFSSGTDIVNGMKGVVESNTRGYIYNSSDKMAFIEFGTGIVGKNTSNISQDVLASIGWQYSEKDNGWWYPTESKPPEGQPSFYDKNTGQWYAWTRGQEAKNIFYNATEQLKLEMPSIIVKTFLSDN